MVEDYGIYGDVAVRGDVARLMSWTYPPGSPPPIHVFGMAVGTAKFRYDGDTTAFNAAWGMSIGDFDDLLAMTRVSALPSTEAQRIDRAAFTGFVAAHFFSTCHDAIRAADEIADIVLVTAHWGENGGRTVRTFERNQAEAWIDAGADGPGRAPRIVPGPGSVKRPLRATMAP